MEESAGKLVSIYRKMNRPKWYYYLNPFLGYFYERRLTRICDSLESVTSLTFKKCGSRFLKISRCCYPNKMDEHSEIYWGRSRPFAYRNALWWISSYFQINFTCLISLWKVDENFLVWLTKFDQFIEFSKLQSWIENTLSVWSKLLIQ